MPWRHSSLAVAWLAGVRTGLCPARRLSALLQRAGSPSAGAWSLRAPWVPGSQLLQPRHLHGQNHTRPLALLSGTFPRPFHVFLFPSGGSFACQPLCFSFFLSTAIEGTALRWLWAGLMVTEREGPLRLNREVEGRRWDRQGPVALGAPARQGLCSRRLGISSRGSSKQGASGNPSEASVPEAGRPGREELWVPRRKLGASTEE